MRDDIWLALILAAILIIGIWTLIVVT